MDKGWSSAGYLIQHQISFGFLNLDLTSGNLRMLRYQRTHSQVAALNTKAQVSLLNVGRVLLCIHRQHLEAQYKIRASELMRKIPFARR